MAFDPDKYLQEKAAPAAAPQGFDPDRYLSEKAEPAKPSRTLTQAAFPGATANRAPVEVLQPWGNIPGQKPLTRTMGPREQAIGAGIMDAVSLPTRAAGAVAGSAGYTGATGGLPFREALANPETGLMRPARKALGQTIANRWSGGEDGQRSVGDAAVAGLAGLGYLGASVVEDPTTLAGLAAKPIAKVVAKTMGGTAKAATGAAAKGSAKVSERLIRRDYLPLKSHEKAGWSHKAAIKHGLYGKDVDDLAAAGNEKLSALYKQQKELIQAGKAQGGRVDFQQALDDAMAKIEKGGDSELWDRAPALMEEYKRRITRIRDIDKADPKAIQQAMSKDVADAQLFKSDLGEDAAFASMKGVPGIDKDAAVRGRFAAILYGIVKDQIEKNVPPGLRDINKAMSEIIPLRNAADYRAAVQGRQRIGKLTDFVLGGGAMVEPTVGLPVLALKKLVDSPRFTKVAVKVQQAAEKMAAAKTPGEASFYAKKLKALGLTSAEVNALSAAPEVMQAPNAIPFRKVAEAETDERRASR